MNDYLRIAAFAGGILKRSFGCAQDDIYVNSLHVAVFVINGGASTFK